MCEEIFHTTLSHQHDQPQLWLEPSSALCTCTGSTSFILNSPSLCLEYSMEVLLPSDLISNFLLPCHRASILLDFLATHRPGRSLEHLCFPFPSTGIISPQESTTHSIPCFKVISSLNFSDCGTTVLCLLVALGFSITNHHSLCCGVNCSDVYPSSAHWNPRTR